jgi:hypothetical protein
MMKCYSPNTRWGKQVVALTVQQWDYFHVFTVEVGGNCLGMSVIDCAVGILYERLDGRLVLKRVNGDTLECTDEEDRGDDWLKNMITSAQIIEWKPPTLNEVRKMNGAKPVKGGNKPWVPDSTSASLTASV